MTANRRLASLGLHLKKKKQSGTKKKTPKKRLAGDQKNSLGVNEASSRASRPHLVGLGVDTHAVCPFLGLGRSRKDKSPHGASNPPPSSRVSSFSEKRQKYTIFGDPRHHSTPMAVGEWTLTSISALPRFFFLCLGAVDPSLRLPQSLEGSCTRCGSVY